MLLCWGGMSGWACWLAEVTQQTTLRYALWTEPHPNANLQARSTLTNRQCIDVTSLRKLPIAAQHTLHCQLPSSAPLMLKACFTLQYVPGNSFHILPDCICWPCRLVHP